MNTRSNTAVTVPAKPGFRPDIAALRALAVTAVVLFHCGVPGVSGGFVGVDVFFVISGYLMTSILTAADARGRLQVLGFYAGRIRRIMPALLVVTLSTLAAGYLLLLPQTYKQLAWDILGADTFTINVAFARTNDYFARRADQSWLLHCWSLAVEIQFYLLIPFVILGSRRISPLRGVRAGLLGIAVLSIAASYVQTSIDAASAFYLPTARAWEFAAGGLVSTLAPLAGRRLPVAILGLGLIVASAVTYSSSLSYPGLWPLIPVLGTALVIWARVDGRVVSAAPVQYLGDISYSVYLWHWPVLMVLGRLLPGGGLLAPAIEVAAGLGLSALTYRYVEMPFRSRHPGAGNWPMAPIAAGMAGVVAASCGVVALAGLPDRIPTEILRVITVMPPEVEWRSRKCFLEGDQSFADLAPECLAKPGDARPRFLLWGDSTVADLYPGLMAQTWSRNFAIEQATAGSCAHLGTLVAANLPHCAEFQKAVFDYIARTKPDYVVVSMAQNNYSGDFDPSSRAIQIALISPMIDIIHRMRAAGVGHVIVAGPAPFWPDGMPETFARQSFAAKALVPRLVMPNDAVVARWNEVVEAAAIGAGASYLSFLGDLCTAGDCLSLVPGLAKPSLIQFDTLHFTTTGAAYVANHFIGPGLGQTIAASDSANLSHFDPVVAGDAEAARSATPPETLPQHFPLTLGRSFRIALDVDFAATQVPFATILQTYDIDDRGFSLEYSETDRATLYVRMVGGTLFAAVIRLTPDRPHHIDMIAQDGHPRLMLDGTLVAKDDEGRMTQSLGDLWVGGSGMFKGRELAGRLKGLSVSGDVVRP